MSLKDKMLTRRDALIRDRADAFAAIEKKQAEIAELERLTHTQFGAIQDVQHWLNEVTVEENAARLADSTSGLSLVSEPERIHPQDPHLAAETAEAPRKKVG